MKYLILAISILLGACATPELQSRLEPEDPVKPKFRTQTDTFVSFDGAELGLTVWEAKAGDPSYVIVGVHGMNDYANAFHLIAPWMAERGVMTYAYDQRGFGRSVNRGIWPDPDLMRRDLRTAISVVRDRHPDTPLAVIGISMGGSVAMTVFGSEDPPQGVNRLILSGPGLRGWGAINALYSSSLWISSHIRPGWIVHPPKGVKIEPSDNIEMLRDLWNDPLGLKENRIDQIYGAVSLMEQAHKAAPKLTADVPTLLTYGARDIVIPDKAMKRTVRVLPEHVRTVFYEDGYHMLLRDKQAENVYADILAFMKQSSADMPSGAPPVPLK